VSAAYPGEDLVRTGLCDLAAGKESAAALAVSIGAARLERIGIQVPRPIASPEHRLYALLQRTHGDGAHHQYNAILRQLTSYAEARECGI